MPQRRTSSVTSFLSDLHFSGKVIMASILFGFGLLLVGAILLVIATGGQQQPPLEENSDAKKTPMTFVGPGVMGVGAFFVIVGTIMCLFETRILRRRKPTDRDCLINSETIPTGNTAASSTEYRDRVIEGCENNLEETEVKTVHADYHIRGSAENAEKKTLAESRGPEKDGDVELSTSAERDQSPDFNSSVYVDAVGENDYDDDDGYDDEKLFVTESNQFSTPPESKPEALSKAAFDGPSDLESDHLKNIDTALAGKDITAEPITESSLPVTKEGRSSLPDPKEGGSSLPDPTEGGSSLSDPKEGESSLSVPKDNGSSSVPNENESALPVPKGDESSRPVPNENESSMLVPNENETSLSAPNDLNTSRILTESSVKATDLTKEVLDSVHDLGSPVKENQDNNTADKEQQGSDQASDESPVAVGKEDSSGSDSAKVTSPSPENSNTTGT